MTFSNFEKYTAGKLNNHSSPVDVEGLWNDILPHVQNDNRRRRGLIWFFFAGLLISIIGIYALTNSNPSGSDDNIAALSTAAIDENKTVKAANPVKKEIIAATNPIDENPNAETQTSSIANKNNKSSKKAKNEKYEATNNSIQTIKTKSIEPPVNVDSDKNYENAENEIAELQILDEAIEPNEITTTIENEEANPIETETKETETEQAIKVDSLESEEEIAFTPPPGRNKFKVKFGVGVYGGLSSSFSSLKDKDGMNTDYLQLRLETEEQLETIQMGLDVVAKSKIGVYLKTGVQYSRIARKFSLSSDITTVDTVEGIQKIYVNENTMDTLYVYGPVPVTTTTTYNKVTYNNFHLMDIPVLLGYSYNNENWSFGVEAGAMFNISTKTKGEIMQADEVSIYNMKEDPLNWFKDNVGVSFTASISVAYQFDDNFQIYLAPTTRFESVFSTDENPIEQKHGSLGINLGARYFIGY